MAAELGLLSLTQLQKLAQHHQQPPHPAAGEISPVSAWMWSPNHLAGQEDDDSWEIRAFEQDTTGNINGTTWPPRSYTCTFCRREFRSAQALGGHMNVHRRDRARLHHQAQPPVAAASMHSNFPSSASTILIPAPEFVSTNGGLCLFYSLANPNHGTAHVLTKKPVNSCKNSQNKSNFPNNNFPNSLNSSICTEPCASNTSFNLNSYESPGDSAVEELDLELRLGRR